MYIDKSLREYIDQTSSKLPAPGGGSVLALVGSLAIGLSQMSMEFTKDKEAFKKITREERDLVLKSMDDLTRLRGEMTSLIDLDSQAFNSVLEAYKLPRDNKERPALIEEGYKRALAIPLSCFNYSYQAIKLEYLMAKYGDKSLITDAGIAGILSYAAMEGSVYNIRINLKGVRDETYKSELLKDLNKTLQEGKQYRDLINEITENNL